MRQLPRLLTLTVLMAGCGLVQHQAAIAHGDSDVVESTRNELISVPLGNRHIDATLSANQRVLLLNPYDNRGFGLLKASLPVVDSSEFSSTRVVVVQFDNDADMDDIALQLMPFIRTGVVDEVAYIATTATDASEQSFLVTSSATIYPTESTTERELREISLNLGFSIERKRKNGPAVYNLTAIDPLQYPSDTVDALESLAEMNLIQKDKTRLNLVETMHDKMRR